MALPLEAFEEQGRTVARAYNDKDGGRVDFEQRHKVKMFNTLSQGTAAYEAAQEAYNRGYSEARHPFPPRY